MVLTSEKALGVCDEQDAKMWWFVNWVVGQKSGGRCKILSQLLDGTSDLLAVFIKQDVLFQQFQINLLSTGCSLCFIVCCCYCLVAKSSSTISQSLLKLLSIELLIPSNHLIVHCSFSSCPQSFPATGSFQLVSSSHKVAKVLELQLQHQSFQWIVRGDFVSFQFSSVTQSCLTLCDPLNHSTPGHPVHHQLPKSTQTHVHWVGLAIQLCHPLLVLPSVFPSIRVFPNESALHIRWSK